MFLVNLVVVAATTSTPSGTWPNALRLFLTLVALVVFTIALTNPVEQRLCAVTYKLRET